MVVGEKEKKVKGKGKAKVLVKEVDGKRYEQTTDSERCAQCMVQDFTCWAPLLQVACMQCNHDRKKCSFVPTQEVKLQEGKKDVGDKIPDIAPVVGHKCAPLGPAGVTWGKWAWCSDPTVEGPPTILASGDNA